MNSEHYIYYSFWDADGLSLIRVHEIIDYKEYWEREQVGYWIIKGGIVGEKSTKFIALTYNNLNRRIYKNY